MQSFGPSVLKQEDRALLPPQRANWPADRPTGWDRRPGAAWPGIANDGAAPQRRATGTRTCEGCSREWCTRLRATTIAVSS